MSSWKIIVTPCVESTKDEADKGLAYDCQERDCAITSAFDFVLTNIKSRHRESLLTSYF